MKETLIQAFEDELRVLRNLRPSTSIESNGAKQLYRVAAGTVRVLEYLARAPHTPARDVARELGMTREDILLNYKLIQRTDAAADFLRSSPNGDYLNIVKHYFSNQMYVVVFFTGLACPGRCRFCPNVTVADDGSRNLALYSGARSERMSPLHIDAVLRDISKIMEQGSAALVKISGGLEPLTDPDTMAVIMDLAEARDIRVKLFTNGILLDTEQRRRLALRAGDVRISLSMIDEEAYAEMMFGSDISRRNRYGLSHLLDNIRALVEERDRYRANTRIGFNTIVLEENHRDLAAFVSLAEDLGLDYIDFKPNYFSIYTKETQSEIAHRIRQIKEGCRSGGIGIYSAGSLSADNLFWQHRDGECSPHKQSRFKMFITPYGICSPVHHGAFPSGSRTGEANQGIYAIGKISRECSLLDLIGNVPALPGLAYEKLNPFEHMLALEIEREEQDISWGIPDTCNPYHFSKRDILPREILENSRLY